MGPSGSGKTTLLSILGCMLTPTSGVVRVAGHDTAGADPYFVAAGAKSPWARRRHIELADLVDELWVFPPSGNRLELLVRDIFGAKGLPVPALISPIPQAIDCLAQVAIYQSTGPYSLPQASILEIAIALPVVSGPIEFT
jgi:putative ABC transport system ATP-binding protein